MWLAGEKVFNIADQGNANQNCDEISLHNRMVLSKRTRDNKCWQGCREKGILVHCWCEYKLVQSLWDTVCRALKKTKK